MEIIIVLLLVGGFIWLVAKGGVAGLIAQQQVKAHAAPKKQNSSIERNIASGFTAETTSATPSTGVDVSQTKGQKLEGIDAFYSNDLSAVEVQLGSCMPDIITKKKHVKRRSYDA
jgi:hypothetical protein